MQNLAKMLNRFHDASQRTGLGMNLDMTKVIFISSLEVGKNGQWSTLYVYAVTNENII